VRVVTFHGHAVKRQRKVADNNILLVFYSRPPQVVTAEEWEAGKSNLYYDSTTAKRRDIVRSL
jgi:hypothetical protein